MTAFPVYTLFPVKITERVTAFPVYTLFPVKITEWVTSFPVFRNDKENEEATVMMADLAFRKNDYEAAMFHFQQLLQKRPDYWVALARSGALIYHLRTVSCYFWISLKCFAFQTFKIYLLSHFGNLCVSS